MASSRLGLYGSFEEIPDYDWYAELSDNLLFPVGYLSRIVVETDSQRQGLGSYLVNVRIAYAASQGARSVLTDVPEYRIDVLKKRGFQLAREPS